MHNNIQLQLDVNIKGVELIIKGEVQSPNKDGIKELSLLGELPHLKDNLKLLLQDEKNDSSFYEAMEPFIPQSLDFGVYKISNDKAQLSLFQLGVGYERFKLKGVFSSELKLFSAGISQPISFEDLPVIGEYLKDNSISNLEFVYIPKKVEAKDPEPKLVNHAIEQFVDAQIWKEKDTLVLAEGFNGGIVFKSANRTNKFRYPYDINNKDDKNKSRSSDNSGEMPTTDSVSNQPAVKKKFPVSISNIKPSLVDKNIAISVDANFHIGPFSLVLIGLGISFPIEAIKHPTQIDFKSIEFNLEGLALTYETPTVQIGGAFLRDASGPNVIYNGLLQIKLIKTEIIAVGSYTKIGNISSLFAFGYLGVNIPLHPAINILGLGIGFGLNRNFVMPPIAKVSTFPIVKVINGEQKFEGEALKVFFKDLNTYIAPEDGCYILMGAIKFESFKVVQTTAIIAVTFGNKLNINLLGISKFEKKGAYNITLGFSVLVDIDEGIFMARGEFSDNSYILSPQIKITGGFAFGMWFKGEATGDFIVSLGGYHPKFEIPKHYPQAIPRIGVEFNIENVHFSAKVYFAVTNTCMMAGLDASLTTNYTSSLLSADIFVRLIADFLIKFQPFSYEAQASSLIHLCIKVEIGYFIVSYSFDLVAQLNIYGPDLGGDGYLSVSKFQIPFKFGEKKKIVSFSKSEFIDTYFPDKDKDKILSYNITSGIIKKFTLKKEKVFIVNPKDFELEITSKIPITITSFDSNEDAKENKIHLVCDNFPELINKLIINNIDTNFIIEPIYQSQPKAIWTDSASQPDPLSAALLEDVCMGVRIKFKQENPKPSLIKVSLYDTLVKEYTNEVSSVLLKPELDNAKIQKESIMSKFGIVTDAEIDTTDLDSAIDVYKYKSQSLGTYNIA